MGMLRLDVDVETPQLCGTTLICDLCYAFRDITSDPVSFPANEMKAFIEELMVSIHDLSTVYVTQLMAKQLAGIKKSTLYALD